MTIKEADNWLRICVAIPFEKSFVQSRGFTIDL